MKRDTELLLLAGLGLFLYQRGKGWWEQQTSVSLPSGAGVPMQGDLQQVDAVLTAMDPAGFADLYNAALQVTEDTFTLDVQPDAFPVPPPPDPDYDLPARVFAMQAAVESGNGRSVYHWNLGNVTTSSGQFFLNPPTDTRHRYAVFLYPLQAARAHVQLVKRKWPEAYRAAYSGDVTTFAKELRPAGKPAYYEGDANLPSDKRWKPYRDAMLARGKRFGWDAGVVGAGTRKPRLAAVRPRG
jgi:hypothetical protein